MLAYVSHFGVVLTLPGIAGFVLSIGMAVDANVLIFERIKEELWAGRTTRAAVGVGFKRAFWTVFDSHVTTMVGALVLYGSARAPSKASPSRCWSARSSRC